MLRSWWTPLSIVVSAVLIGGLYILKGWYIAGMLGGRYPLRSALTDGIAVAIVVLLLRLIYAGMERGVNWAVGTDSRSQRALAQVIRLVLLLAFAVPFLLTLAQFFPQRLACTGTPAELYLSYEPVELRGSAGNLSAWYVPGMSEEDPLVLVTHGLGANKENFLTAVYLAHQLGFGALILDFRAHGDSEGHATTFGYLEAEDIESAVAWAKSRFPDRPLYALAYSMGGAAVLRAAANIDPFEKLVIDSSFASAEGVAKASILQNFGIFQAPAWFAGRCWGELFTGVDLGDHIPANSIAKLKHRPILLVHGTDDSLIPPAESQRLLEAAGPNASLWLVPGAGHTGSIDHPDYMRRIGEHFRQPKMSQIEG